MKRQDFPLFDGLTDEEVAVFIGTCDPLEIDSGERFIVEGQESGELYFIIEGAVRVFVTVNGRDRDLAEIDAPCLMGELEFLTSGRRSASVVATKRVRAHRIGAETLRRRINAGDAATLQVFFNVTRVVARRLTRMNERLSQLIEDPNSQRTEELAAFRNKLLSDWTF